MRQTMTRLIDADKLYPDCLTKDGTLAISQSQIANAPTVEYTFEEAFQKTICEKRLYCPCLPHGKKERLTMTVPNYRTYEDYHDAVQYARGWNDAMQYIFGKEADNDRETNNS